MVAHSRTQKYSDSVIQLKDDGGLLSVNMMLVVVLSDILVRPLFSVLIGVSHMEGSTQLSMLLVLNF